MNSELEQYKVWSICGSLGGRAFVYTYLTYPHGSDQRLTMLEGRGRPLRFVCVGCRKPEGFGMPVAPVVTCVSFELRVSVSNCSFGFVSLPYRLPREDADDRLCKEKHHLYWYITIFNCYTPRVFLTLRLPSYYNNRKMGAPVHCPLPSWRSSLYWGHANHWST